MSTITVYGATGMIGGQIVKEAVRRGHTVLGVTRHTPKEPVDGVAYRTGDLADTASVLQAASDSDVLVIAVPSDRTGGSHEPMLKAHRDLIAARPQTRLFIVGGAGSLLNNEGVRLLDAPGFPDIYKAESTTFAAVLDYYRASEGLDWVMECPAPEIGPGEASAKHVLGTDSPVGDFVSSGTFAVAALDEIEKPSVRNGRFTVANA